MEKWKWIWIFVWWKFLSTAYLWFLWNWGGGYLRRSHTDALEHGALYRVLAFEGFWTNLQVEKLTKGWNKWFDGLDLQCLKSKTKSHEHDLRVQMNISNSEPQMVRLSRDLDVQVREFWALNTYNVWHAKRVLWPMYRENIQVYASRKWR